MKHFILFNLILLTACSEPTVVHHPVPLREQDPSENASQQQVESKDPWEGDWQPADIDLAIRMLEESPEDFEPEVVHPGIINHNQLVPSPYPQWELIEQERPRLAHVEQKQNWQAVHDTLTDDGTNEYQIYQALKTQLGCESLRLKYRGNTGTTLQYEAEHQGKYYEVEYDLKTVRIIKVINTERSPALATDQSDSQESDADK